MPGMLADWTRPEILQSRWAAVPFLLAILLLNVTSMWHKSVTYDEPAHLRFGHEVLTRPQIHADFQRMPATAVNALIDMGFHKLHPTAAPDLRLFVARLPTVFFAVTLGWFVFVWSRELWGNWGGLFSLCLYTFSPSMLGHSHWITNDLTTALLVLLVLRSFIHYTQDRSLRSLILCAVLVGFAQVTKQSNLLLFPILGVLWLVARRQGVTSADVKTSAPSAARFRTGAARLLCFVSIAILVINACYGFKGSFMPIGYYLDIPWLSGRAEDWSWLRILPIPVPVPEVYLQTLWIGTIFNATGEGHGPIYLLGELDQFGWWYYYLVALLFKLPLGLFVLLGLSTPAVAAGVRQGRLEDIAFVLTPLALLIFFSASSAQIGIRYLLPALPLIFVSLGRLLKNVPTQFPGERIAIAAATAWMVVSSLSYHPHYLSYFNELIGSRKNMYKVLADSNVDWGQNLYYLQKYVATHRAQSISIEPNAPATGTVIVPVNKLVGVTAPAAKFAWLRQHEPVDNIAYSYLVYEIPGSE